MSLVLLERPTMQDQDKEEHFTHIVLEGFHVPKDDEGAEKDFVSSDNSVIDGTVFGKPVKALCGFEWVPGRNPHRYPLCPKCAAIAKERGWKVPTA